MNRDYDGREVLDADEQPVGTVEHTYIDGDGVPQYIEVKMGTFFAKHRLIPLAGAALTGDSLRVPYSKSTIEHSPDVSDSDVKERLTGDLLDDVRAFYDGASQLQPITDQS